jgi:hydantoinase/carbamoylase family amidase
MQRAESILQRIHELATASDDESCLTRIYGTKAFVLARNKVEQWMRDAGLKTRVDNIGNVRGRMESPNAAAKTLVIASHLDTVVNAGKFDGPLGVLMGLDLLEQLAKQKTALPFHIELIGFSDEEGCRFHTTYLGSKVVAGSLDRATLDVKDAAGNALSSVIAAMGGDVNKLSKDAIAREDWLGYFEMHIEQGPVLYERDIPVGIVQGIAGQRRVNIAFTGEAGHAGTVPMAMRNDALACAAEFILAVEKLGQHQQSELVATVGKLEVINAASNVIPGLVSCSLDIRSANETILSNAYDLLRQEAGSICEKRGIELEWKLVQATAPVDCDTGLNAELRKAIEATGMEVIELVSGAGHDAVPVSAVAPVAMLFVRCYKGISHNPLENVDLRDLELAIQVADRFIKLLIDRGADKTN